MSVRLDYADQQALADFLTQDRDGFLDWIARFRGAGRNRPYMHDVTAKTYRSSGTQSLVLTIDDDTGAAQDVDTTTYRNFAITDDAVTFFFGEDEAVTDNGGPHQVAVPRTELATLLALS